VIPDAGGAYLGPSDGREAGKGWLADMSRDASGGGGVGGRALSFIDIIHNSITS